MKNTTVTPATVFKYWVPIIAWMGVIFAFSAFPTSPSSKIHWQDFIVKKTAHLVEYGILSTLLYRALVAQGVKKKKAGYTAIVFCMFYGASDEFHQSFTPGREPTLRDAIIDTIGASLAIYFIWNILPKAPKKLKSLAKSLELL